MALADLPLHRDDERRLDAELQRAKSSLEQQKHRHQGQFVYDEYLISSILENSKYPTAILTPLGDIVAFNSYYYHFLGLSDKTFSLLKTGKLRSNILRIFFEEQFQQKAYLGGDQLWQEQAEFALQLLRSNSQKYSSTARYKEIIELLSTNRDFVELLNKPFEALIGRQQSQLFHGLHQVTIHHQDYGPITFLKLRALPQLVDPDMLVFYHPPVATSHGQYQNLQNSVKKNRIFFFEGNWSFLRLSIPTDTQTRHAGHHDDVEDFINITYNRYVTRELELTEPVPSSQPEGKSRLSKEDIISRARNWDRLVSSQRYEALFWLQQTPFGKEMEDEWKLVFRATPLTRVEDDEPLSLGPKEHRALALLARGIQQDNSKELSDKRQAIDIITRINHWGEFGVPKEDLNQLILDQATSDKKLVELILMLNRILLTQEYPVFVLKNAQVPVIANSGELAYWDVVKLVPALQSEVTQGMASTK